MPILLSDLLHGTKTELPGDKIWNNEYADCAELKRYPKNPKNGLWMYWIIGEHFFNRIYTLCERCGEVAVERCFSEESVSPNINHLFCFHCNEIMKEYNYGN